MSIQFLGMIGHRLASEIIPASGPLFDKEYIARFARAHEDAGFDRILVGYWSDQPVRPGAGSDVPVTVSTSPRIRPGYLAESLSAGTVAPGRPLDLSPSTKPANP